jgi:hypothetical protein
VATIMAAVAAPTAALAAQAHTVTVRVEGRTKTLLPATLVHLHSGSVTKGGAPKGACSENSEAGALDLATHHRWVGKFYAKYSDYLISSILGEKYSATAKYFWEVFADNVPATGACETKRPHAGEKLLFAAVPLADAAAYPLVISGAPKHATAGQAFKVKVDYVNGKGKMVALGGATLSGKDFTQVVTSANGTAAITPTKSGTLTLGASHADATKASERFGYIRSASVTLAVN